MPTIFILAVFSLVFTIIAGMISNGTSNVAVLTKQRAVETHDYFENIAKVTLGDITNAYYQANPNNATSPGDFIKGLSEMKRLSTGRLGDPTLDSWGTPILGKIFTQYEPFSSSTDTNNNVMLPVTTFAFVSAGPDRVLQTAIPATVTNASQVQGITVSSSMVNGELVTADDIVYTFDNRKAQQLLLDSIKLRLNRIGSAALKQVQSDLADYRQSKLTDYQLQISQGKDVSITSVVDISNNSSAPHFQVLDNSTQGIKNRQKLGVDEDFAILEAPLAGGGKFLVSSTAPATPSDPMQIILLNSNENTNKTPWGDPAQTKKFRYQITIQAVSATLAI